MNKVYMNKIDERIRYVIKDNKFYDDLIEFTIDIISRFVIYYNVHIIVKDNCHWRWNLERAIENYIKSI